jgi:cyclopropane fatty-acyl-phospholipid synthase-like methyltransferase
LSEVPERPGTGFDRFHADYDEALARGLAVSGEDRLYFARARIAFLGRCLRRLGVPPPSSVLDFGCGTGAATPYFFE